MNNERTTFGINENNCVILGKTLTVTVPYEVQNWTGCELYFEGDYLKEQTLTMKSVTINSSGEILYFWNWLASTGGTGSLSSAPSIPFNISAIRSTLPGSFGFSGITNDKSDITVTFTVEEDLT